MMAEIGWTAGEAVDGVLGWLLTYAVHSTILLGVAALVTASLIRTDAWRETLWRAALIGALLTATLQSGLGLRPFAGEWRVALRESRGVASSVVTRPRAEEPRASMLGAEARGVEAPYEAVGGPTAVPEGPGTRGENNAVEAERRSDALVEPGLSFGPGGESEHAESGGRTGLGETASGGWSWAAAVLTAWGVVALLLLVRLFFRQILLHRLLRDRHPVTEGGLLSELATLRRNAGVWRPIGLTAAAACPGPIALGTSEICVPDRFLHDLDVDQQRSALAHELAHLARRDPLWHLLSGLLEALFFFQPLNRLARLRLRETAENLSDDWAVRQTGSPLGLARCLAEVASWVGRAPVAPGTLHMAEGGSPLLLRVERLLGRPIPHPPERNGGRSTAAAGLVLLVWLVAPAVTAGALLDQEGSEADGVVNDVGGRQAQFEGGANEADEGATQPGPAGQEGIGQSGSGPGEESRKAQGGAEVQDRVIRHPSPSEPLGSRWQWAVAEAERNGEPNYWVAYAFERDLPPEYVHIDDSRGWSSRELERTPIGTLIYGPSYRRPVDARLLGRPSSEPPQGRADMIRQPLIVLFHVLRTGGGEPRVGRLSLRSASAGMDLRDANVYWLGTASDTESFDWLRGRLDALQDMQLQAAVVEAMSMHEETDRVLAFLEEVVHSRRPSDVREDAVEGVAWHPVDRGVALLRTTALEDPSSAVREEAAETLGELRIPAASVALDEVLRFARSDGVREEAVEALAMHQQPEVLETLRRVAMEDASEDIQEEAIEAIAHFPAESALPALDQIARTHDRMETRREAIEALGALDPAATADILEQILQQGDAPAELRDEAIEVLAERRSPETLEVIFQVAMNDPDPDMQEEAIEHLVEFDPVAVLPRLERIVWEHPIPELQAEAVEALADLPADLAIPLLEEIIANHEDSRLVQEAIESLAEFPSAVSMSRLLRVLREHPLEDARRKALDELADMTDSS